MSVIDSMERKEEYQEYYDTREARPEELGSEIDEWEPKEDDTSEQDVDNYYEEVGRLKSRLEATRRRLEAVKETHDDWEQLRTDIDQAISDLERHGRGCAEVPVTRTEAFGNLLCRKEGCL